MTQNRFVLDVSIWVSYILQKRLENLVVILASYNLIIFISPNLLAELEDVLQRPKIKKYLTSPYKTYIDFIIATTTSLSPDLKFKEAPDPKDNYLFDLAVAAEAGILVTGDKLLLEKGTLAGVQIISFRAFRGMFGEG